MKTSEHLSPFIKRNHVSIWNWIQRYNKPGYISQKRKKVSSEFIIDETLLKVRNEFVWPWIAIEPIDNIILGIRRISFERTCLLLNDFYKNWLGNMENIRFQPMEVHGIHHRLVNS